MGYNYPPPSPPSPALELDNPGSNPDSFTYQLCYLGVVIKPPSAYLLFIYKMRTIVVALSRMKKMIHEKQSYAVTSQNGGSPW